MTRNVVDLSERISARCQNIFRSTDSKPTIYVDICSAAAASHVSNSKVCSPPEPEVIIIILKSFRDGSPAAPNHFSKCRSAFQSILLQL